MHGVLRARGLVKRFRDRTAVAGVDLDVAAGERVALLGPNGAGKTTTLLMTLGAILPDEGTVEILGHRRGLVDTTVAASFHDRPAAGPSDCESTKPKSELVDDVDFFLNGFATLTPISLS